MIEVIKPLMSKAGAVTMASEGTYVAGKEAPNVYWLDALA